MRDLYPDVPRWGHESGISWLSQAALKSAGFFFSKDMSRMSGIVDRMVEIARHKAIFRATRPDGNWDYNISETSWGPRSTYVEHSHLLPELYYILSGPVIYGVDGDLHEVGPGDILFNNSYAPHLAQGIVDGLVFDNFGSTWAPNGDRSVFDHPFLLLESLPAQSSTSRLGAAPSFH
jgi:quercetin dioxygenase-like cupin family protein